MYKNVFILLLLQTFHIYSKASFRGAPSAHPDWIVPSVDEEVEMKFQRTIYIFIKLSKDRRWWGNSSFSLQSAIDKGAPLNEALRYAFSVNGGKQI